jgi:nitroreductase
MHSIDSVSEQSSVVDGHDFGETMFSAITSRHSVSPKALQAPGPSDEQLQKLIEVAACAPDHGLLRPWRFILFPEDKRPVLADLFEEALLERHSEATEEDRSRAREKAARAPLLLGVVVHIDKEDEKVAFEDQIASAGAALQNVLLQVHAYGFGARATSGRAVRTNAFRKALSLHEDEVFLCFLAIGTATRKAKTKERPDPQSLLTSWP